MKELTVAFLGLPRFLGSGGASACGSGLSACIACLAFAVHTRCGGHACQASYEARRRMPICMPQRWKAIYSKDCPSSNYLLHPPRPWLAKELHPKSLELC